MKQKNERRMCVCVKSILWQTSSPLATIKQSQWISYKFSV